MPRFTMTYPYARLYPSTLGLVEPGQEIEADENPDPNHFVAIAEPVKPARQDTTPTAPKSKATEAPTTTEPEEATD